MNTPHKKLIKGVITVMKVDAPFVMKSLYVSEAECWAATLVVKTKITAQPITK